MQRGLMVMHLGMKVFALCACLAFTAPSIAAAPQDWSVVPTHEVRLFYPGQSSYQWLRSGEHAGQRLVRQGAACTTCHGGEEVILGESLVAGGKLEPHPISGKQPIIKLFVQAVYDTENIYLRFQWKTQNDFPGTRHPHWRFDGINWNRYGAPRLHADVWKDGKPAIYEDRLSLMIDDGSVPLFAEQGCWLSCHDSMRDMSESPSTNQVRLHPLLGKSLRKDDVRKYLPSSREDESASWDRTKPADKITEIMKRGAFADLMQWRAHRSNPLGMADDGYVLEYRLTDAGHNMFDTNWDEANKRPKYMFDETKLGFRSRTEEELAIPSKALSLIVEENATEFDPDLGWTEGEMLPEYYLTRVGALGSAADNANVKGSWQNGEWTVVWVRKLDTEHSDDKVLKPGGIVTIGIAVHDDNITTRGHHVSFPLSLGLGVKADITATKLQ